MTKTPDLRETLKQQFKHTTLGDYFRTLSYANPHSAGTTEWLEAIYVGGRSEWVIRKAEQRDTSINADGITHKTDDPCIVYCDGYEATGLTFFDAVEYLAKYELAMPRHGYSPADLKEPEHLKQDYFRNFAKAEGLAFYVSGMPAPTQNGHIVLPGAYPPDSRKQAREAFANKAKLSVRPVPASILPKVTTENTATFHKQYLILHEINAELKKAVEELDWMPHCFTQTYELEIAPIEKLKIDRIRKRILAGLSKIRKHLKNPALESMDDHETFRDEADKALKLFTLHMNIFMIRGTMLAISQKREPKFFNKKRLGHAIRDTVKIMHDLGYDADEAKEWVEKTSMQNTEKYSHCLDSEAITEVENWFRHVAAQIKHLSGAALTATEQLSLKKYNIATAPTPMPPASP